MVKTKKFWVSDNDLGTFLCSYKNDQLGGVYYTFNIFYDVETDGIIYYIQYGLTENGQYRTIEIQNEDKFDDVMPGEIKSKLSFVTAAMCNNLIKILRRKHYSIVPINTPNPIIKSHSDIPSFESDW